MKKIFISAGDTSGDIHAARLMRELKIITPDIQFYGIGGNAMIKEGLTSLATLKDISVVGFWEVAKNYSLFSNLIKKSKEILINEKIDCFLPIDYPGFNLRLADFAKKNNIPVYYYIAPQLWAWGKKRAKKLQKNVDKLLVVFPFEVDYFKKFSINTEFVGHPLLDDDIFNKDNINSQRQKLIAILPGSRRQEIERHLPLIENILKIFKEKLPDYKIGIAKSATLNHDIYKDLLVYNNCELWDDTRQLMLVSRAGIIKSGTSTLEAALCNLPYITFYKTSEITYQVGKYLINLPYISIVNILLNGVCIKEFIQHEATAKNITNEIINILSNNTNDFSHCFDDIRKLLGEKGASRKAAEIIINELNK